MPGSGSSLQEPLVQIATALDIPSRAPSFVSSFLAQAEPRQVPTAVTG